MSGQSVSACGPNLVCLAAMPWSDQWKRHQSIVHHLSMQPGIGRVVFINPSVRLGSLLSFLFRRSAPSLAMRWVRLVPRATDRSVIVWSPLRVFPFSRTFGVIARVESRVLCRFIRWLNGSQSYDLMILGVNPGDRDLQRGLRSKARRVIFDWSDDFAEFSVRPAKRSQFQEVTEELIQTADLVLTVNDHLSQRARAMRKADERVLTLPNATNLVAQDDAGQRAEALRLRLRLSRPIIGYAGTITELRLDLDLLHHIARLHQEWTLVFIGHVMSRVSEKFAVRGNMVFLPAVPHEALLDYLNMFDVCIIPHTVNAHTNGNDPIKIYDYLMAGKPVVSTAVAGVERFRDVVDVADNHDMFVRQIEQCLAQPKSALRARRVAIARENSWPSRISDVLQALDGGPLALERKTGHR